MVRLSSATVVRFADAHDTSARARRDDGTVDVIQTVLAAYDRDHAVILLTDAIENGTTTAPAGGSGCPCTS